MFPHDLSAAQRGESDRPVRSQTGLIGPGHVFQTDPTSFRYSPANCQRCAGRGVQLLAVMDLKNFRIIIRQARTKLPRQFQKQRQRRGEIGGLKDGNVLRRRVHRILRPLIEAGRPQNPVSYTHLTLPTILLV